jgi:membrane protease YdiL (CAAX protease family)
MLVRITGYWQDHMFAEKASIIALTVSSIVLIDRSSIKYFGVQFDKPYSQVLWALLAIAILWSGFALYRFGLPLMLGLKTTGVLIETPVFDIKFIIYGLLLIFWNFSEELFFRGYVIVKLEQSIRFWLSLAISSVLFGLYHVNYILSYKGSDPVGYIAIYILFCTLFGVGMGLLFKLTKSVFVTTAVHVFWNLFFASRYLIPKLYIDYGKSAFPLADYDYMFATVFFIIVLLALYAIMRRKARSCGQTI